MHDNESKQGYNFEETLESNRRIKKYHLDARGPHRAVGGREKLPEYREKSEKAGRRPNKGLILDNSRVRINLIDLVNSPSELQPVSRNSGLLND